MLSKGVWRYYSLATFKTLQNGPKSTNWCYSQLDRSIQTSPWNLSLSSCESADWNVAVSEGAKLIDYQTSFINMPWVSNKALMTITMALGRLDGSGHPVATTVRNTILNIETLVPKMGLIIALISKTASQSLAPSGAKQEENAGILQSQRDWIKAVELMRTNCLMKKSLINLQPGVKAVENPATKKQLVLGNKVSVILGDYFFAEASIQSADLRNAKCVTLVHSILKDFAEYEFMGVRDEQNCPLPTAPNLKPGIKDENNEDFDYDKVLDAIDIDKVEGTPEREWELRTMLSGGNLLSKGCMGALELAGLSEEVQRNAYLFGKHLALAWQAHDDLIPFITSEYEKPFSLVSAPVLFHLDAVPTLYSEVEKGKKLISAIQFRKIHSEVVQGPGVMKTKRLKKTHEESAMKYLKTFPENDSRRALEKIIIAKRGISV